jgi:DNA-directed RNA polymerase specialized sigma24 family protein
MQENSHESLRRAIAARSEMRRAVDTKPADEWFHPYAHDLLGHALVPGQLRDDLLIVMQKVRLSVERYAVHCGLPVAVLAETAEDTGSTARLGHFEHDLVHAYLPAYLERVDGRDIDVCFRLHARSAYRDTLRQRCRREGHRVELWHKVPVDARTRQEIEVTSAEEPNTIATGATHFAQWVPTPGEVHETLGFQRELESMLDPLDYQIAELLMKYRIVQGDKGEIARLLSASEGRQVSQSRVTRAVQNIRTALEQIRSRRGFRRW